MINKKKYENMTDEEYNSLSKKEKLLKFVRNPKEIISFFLPIILAFICLIPVPYYITIGGGTIPMDKKISIEGEHKNKGSLNSAYVKQIDGKIITYLFAKLVRYDMEEIENVTLEKEKIEEYEFRERLSFTNSLNTAAKVAYEYLGKDFKIKEEKIYIIYIEPNAKTDLKSKDQIMKVEGKDVKKISDVMDIVNEYEYKDELKITVLRDEKEVNCKAKLIDIDNEKKMGIYIENEYIFETDPKIEFNFGNSEAGPSGGLMMTLTIYNKLVSEDITGGKRIVGTGTINEEGEVGEIGGIKYKLKGAVSAKADIFICPKENLEEALNEQKKHNYKIKIIGVSTFEEAINELNELKK